MSNSKCYRMALGTLLLGYQMDVLMVATASSLAFSAGGFTVKALLITAFLCYSISVLLVGLVNLGDFMESVVLPVAGAILSILAGIFILCGITVNNAKLTDGDNDVISYQSVVYSVSLLFALISGGLLIFGKLRGSNETVVL